MVIGLGLRGALKLAETFAPAIVGLLTKDDTTAKAVAMVSETAQLLTGTASDDAAFDALEADPVLQAEYRDKLNERAVKIYELETERHKTDNETVRLLVANKDKYVRRMRPTFGYSACFSLNVMFLTIVYTMLRHGPEEAVKMIEAYATMEWVFVALFAAIGVYIKKRSDDKKPLIPGAGLLGALVGLRRK